MKRWLCTALLAAAWPVAAQESMVFSKPADLPTEKANDFMGDQHRSLGSYNSSSSLFGNKPQADFDILPGAQKPQLISPEQIKQWQKSLDDKKNWTLLTPEEIMGIPTPEQILGLPDPNHEENLSAEERYLRRQDRQQNFSANNAMRQMDNSKEDDASPFYRRNLEDATDPQKFQANRLTGAYRQLNGSASSLPGADPNGDSQSLWHSAFTFAPPAPKPDAQQVALMADFHTLLEQAAPENLAANPEFSPSALSPPLPLPDHNLQPMPAFNPAGRSFTPMADTAGRPMGINPLPTITGQTPNQPAPKPKPLVKPPPWLANQPDPNNPYQRKF